ncbi:TetR/AcrR family transcriptional regulator [Sinorhizobium mexicanum]|uniref:TetR/AcrR family transcriptional regulator n=1 Tax=Sinorhizobium mexicanum TaxID=375549 RepID=A0A859QCN8_9HYPH|nr:TetR/AcrR family transcriptional regulator [Sinorhizobium mexicanum]MBP1887406.1 AcrR family transcriptional regulator [Sinorhizobium mexicanum]QLL62303.1 TetR/AcrR family transcriptional regulator [Sinorhizobium mexicanum]
MTERMPARERLLNAAAELFYREGVGATGIDAITAHAGVAKMSLYNNFSSKADLVNAYMQRRLDEWRDVYQERLRSATTPQERILAVFDSYVDHAALAYAWGFRGCGLLNAAAELPVGDPGRAVVAVQKEEVERLFREHLLEMQPAAGSAIDETAQHLSFLLEGAMSRAGLDGHDARLKTARKIATSVLDQF